MIKRIVLLILAIALTFSLLSCSGADNEALMVELPGLIQEGRELLDIVYGKGLTTDAERAESIREGYVCVSENAPYQSTGELKVAFAKVFSKEYETVLYMTALNNITYEGGDISPRYLESKEGLLFVDSSYESQILEREPLYNSIKIIKSNRFMAEIEITMIYNDGREEAETFVVVNEDGKWKLDSSVL